MMNKGSLSIIINLEILKIEALPFGFFISRKGYALIEKIDDINTQYLALKARNNK